MRKEWLPLLLSRTSGMLLHQRHWRTQMNPMLLLVVVVVASNLIVPACAQDDFVRHHHVVQDQAINRAGHGDDVLDRSQNKETLPKLQRREQQSVEEVRQQEHQENQHQQKKHLHAVHDIPKQEMLPLPNVKADVDLPKTVNINNFNDNGQKHDAINKRDSHNDNNHDSDVGDNQLRNIQKQDSPFQANNILKDEKNLNQNQVNQVLEGKLPPAENKPQDSNVKVNNNEFVKKEAPVSVNIDKGGNSQNQNGDNKNSNFKRVVDTTVRSNIDGSSQVGQNSNVNSLNAVNNNNNQWVRNELNNPQQQKQFNQEQPQQQQQQLLQQSQESQQQLLQQQQPQAQQQQQQQLPQQSQESQQQLFQQQQPQPQQQQQQFFQQQPQQKQPQFMQQPPQPPQQQQFQQQPLPQQQFPQQPLQPQQQQPFQPQQQQPFQPQQQQPLQPQHQQYQQQPQEQSQPQIGGLEINWDWEDFSIMFNSYGGAEMKVRRAPHPTTGEPWPLPQYYTRKDNKIFKVSKDVNFIAVGVKCDILEEGFIRHQQRIVRGSVEDMYDNLQNAEGTPFEDPTLRYGKDEFLKAPVITRVEVKIRKPCTKYPALESDESYDLVVKKKKTYIWANEVWGALRGLETFGHLVWKGTDEFLYIKETVIGDYPRFPHRGLLIDTSRHFLFKEVILDILDSMEMNKLNVFHWHIVDDQSFPYESKVYPELSRKGAFHPTYVYSLEDIADIIEYARLRGIRVMPEFDTPGHTYAWGLSRPELLTQCYSGSIPVKGYLGPIDPSKNSTYRFLQTLFQEIIEVFKDEYMHLGGDEVPLGCWQSNPEVLAFAQELARRPRAPQQQGQYVNNGWTMFSDDIRRVYEYYENRLMSIISEAAQKKKKKIKYVMWQEVMNNNLQLPNDTIIQVWMGDMGDVNRATSMGYQVLYSTCWYLDHLEYGTKWTKYYSCDPVDQNFGYRIDEKKVLGGEAAFWSEYFSNENLISLMWPRASAAAERLWSNKDVKNLEKAAKRLSEHRCRMLKRGINVGEISGPGYCLHTPQKRRLFNETIGCRGGNCSHFRSLIQEDFEVFVRQKGGGSAECGGIFNSGTANVFILLIVILGLAVALYALSKSSSRFHRMKICKNRFILVVFVVVLLVYFLCYTTIWIHAFEFSGSFHKTLQEDNLSETHVNNVDDATDLKPTSS